MFASPSAQTYLSKPRSVRPGNTVFDGALSRRAAAVQYHSPMPTFSVALPGHRLGALDVWRAANMARHKRPSPARVARVREKLEDASVCLVVGSENGKVIAMAMAEPTRARHGAGRTVPRSGHVSMVFVAPDRWGQGIGSQLLDAVHHEMHVRGWETSFLWTGSSNTQARRLYEGHGYSLTGEIQHHSDETIVRYQLQLAEHA
jgi:ribosomal protein S18 acetylase RimI-like enzyme